MLVLIGGTLLITPGFLSDVVGLVFLLPPTRAAIRPRLTRLFARRLGVAGLVPPAGPSRRPSSHRNPTVVEGEVIDPEQQEGPPPGGERP